METVRSTLQLRLHEPTSSEACEISLRQLVIASWTGRDRKAMEGRLAELEALGISRPPALPMFYPIASARATTRAGIEVVGSRTTGEAEFVLLRCKGKVWVGLGSDHTDRGLEAMDPGLSKQVCDKPVGGEFWALDALEPHWDDLRLRSFVTDAAGVRTPYQDGSVTAMLPPRDLLARWALVGGDTEGAMLFCGTLPTIGPIRPASRFEVELDDPVGNRRLQHAYTVSELSSESMRANG